VLSLLLSLYPETVSQRKKNRQHNGHKIPKR
jgi:hypothetical protein